MFCSNCGTNLSEDAKFCPNCGERTDATPVTKEVITAPAYEESYNNNKTVEVYEHPAQPEQPVQQYYTAPAAEEKTPEPSYYAPAQPQQPYTAPQAPAYQGEKPNTTLWIILSAVSVLFCCLPGIIALVFAIIANSNANANDISGVNSKLKAAKICFWIAIGLGIVSTVCYMLLILFSDGVSYLY